MTSAVSTSSGSADCQPIAAVLDRHARRAPVGEQEHAAEAIVVRKPPIRRAAASHQAPISSDALTRMTFGQKPENGGRPQAARKRISETAASQPRAAIEPAEGCEREAAAEATPPARQQIERRHQHDGVQRVEDRAADAARRADRHAGEHVADARDDDVAEHARGYRSAPARRARRR